MKEITAGRLCLRGSHRGGDWKCDTPTSARQRV